MYKTITWSKFAKAMRVKMAANKAMEHERKYARVVLSYDVDGRLVAPKFRI